jgi:hypothetical protein
MPRLTQILRDGIREPRVDLLFVGAAVVWNLVTLRAELWPVAYLNDSSMHEEMVRFATLQWQRGAVPLTAWFPYLGLGSPHFLHYQSLPAMLTGLAGVVIGPNAAFRWSLYLLLCGWPVSVYAGARLFGLPRAAGAGAAVLAPFLMSATHIGYETKSYIWTGFGVWTQLWAAIVLPIAWGASWRAVRDGTGVLLAVAAIALTSAFHFETGYLAFLPLLIWPLAASGGVRARLRRAVLIGGLALAATSWVIIPLLSQRPWAATNEILQGTPLVDGYGAGQVLSWLVRGQLLDWGRLPVITLAAAVGLAWSLTRWSDLGRALFGILVACTVLSFGRATFGSLANLLPGSADIFFRRFMMGIQLAALLLAGMGASLALARLRRWLRAIPRWPRLQAVAIAALGLAVLAPAWTQLEALTAHNASAIRAQQRAQRRAGPAVSELLRLARYGRTGRVYAGMPTNWGARFRVGAVPVFEYLASRDVDEVGYTLRTASLMTDPEYFFDERNPSDYVLFGIRYLLLPREKPPPVPAARVASAGRFVLWRVRSGGLVHVGVFVGAIAANRSDIGTRSYAVLTQSAAVAGQFIRVNFGTRATGAGAPVLLPFSPRGSGPPGGGPPLAPAAGAVLSQTADLTRGRARATVRLRRAGVVVLSASFDPGWRIEVDGRPVPTVMAAPALVAAKVPAGVHSVTFTFRGFGGYPWLLALTFLALAGAWGAGRLEAGGDRCSRP